MSTAGAIKAGRAYVEAFMDASQLEKSLGQIRDKLKTFSRQVGAIGGAVTGMGAAIIGPMTAAVKIFADAGDKLHKMSQRTGLSVEALSALDFAASQSGGSIDALEKSMIGLARFMLQVEQGSATAVGMLDEIGVSVEELQQSNPEERFLLLAEALSRVADPTKKAGLAMQFFGRSGTEMLPMLNAGEKGIAAMMARAEELGIVMSQEDADAAARLTDMLDELYRSVESVGRTIATALIPTAVEFSNWLRDMVPAVRSWLEENREMIVNAAKLGGTLVAVGTGIIGVAAAINTVSVAAGTAQAATKLLAGNLSLVGKAATGAFAVLAIIEMAKYIYNTNDAVKDLNRSLKKGVELNKELLNRRDTSNAGVMEQANQLTGADRDAFLADQIAEAEKNLAGMNASLAGQKKLVAELAPSWTGLWQAGRKEWEVEKQELDTISDQIQQQKKFVDELRKAKRQQQMELDEFAGRTREEVTGINGILDRLNEQLETFGMDAGEKAVRELEKLNANEEELAEARQKLADLAAKESAAAAQKAAEEEQRRAEEEAASASESIAKMLQALADEVSDLKLPDADREMEKRLRELRRLGANEEQLKAARDLLLEKSGLSTDGGDVVDNSPSSQGGTFSSLAGLMFDGRESTVTEGEKQIVAAIKESGKQVVTAVDESGRLA